MNRRSFLAALSSFPFFGFAELSKPVEVIAFDVYGTLVDWYTSVREEFLRVGGKEEDTQKFVDGWLKGYVGTVDKVQSGKIPWCTVESASRITFQRLIEVYKLKTTAAELTEIWTKLKPWPDTNEALKRLKTKYITVTLSNGNTRILVDLCKNVGMEFDQILSAEMVRRYKPSPEVYEQVPRLFGVDAESVLMVAAHEYDLVAAKKCGFQTCFVARPMEYGVKRAVKCEKCDFFVNDLAELCEKLGVVKC